jgi:hypothetical protein
MFQTKMEQKIKTHILCLCQMFEDRNAKRVCGWAYNSENHRLRSCRQKVPLSRPADSQVYSSLSMGPNIAFHYIQPILCIFILTLSDPTSNIVRQYDFPVLLRCRKTSDTGFVAFVRPLSEPVRRFSSCSTDFSQQIAQAVLFLLLYDFLF